MKHYKYQIVSGNHQSILAKLVDEELSEGWQPIGGIGIERTHDWVGGIKVQTTIYHQAMGLPCEEF